MRIMRKIGSKAAVAIALGVLSCARHDEPLRNTASPYHSSAAPHQPKQNPSWFEERREEREQLVRRHLEPGGITDPRVLAAMRHVPRHRFVPEGNRDDAYLDQPLPIGWGQTISQQRHRNPCSNNWRSAAAW